MGFCSSWLECARFRHLLGPLGCFLQLSHRNCAARTDANSARSPQIGRGRNPPSPLKGERGVFLGSTRRCRTGDRAARQRTGKKHCRRCRHVASRGGGASSQKQTDIVTQSLGKRPGLASGLVFVGRPSRLQRNRWISCPNVGAWGLVRSDCPVPRSAGFCRHLGDKKPPRCPLRCPNDPSAARVAVSPCRQGRVFSFPPEPASGSTSMGREGSRPHR